ncbi:MAG: hypothetical protein RR048_07185, partial [Oscillospiraceae bacterium]
GKITEVDSELEQGKVADQSPAVAEKVKTNTPVDIKISSGNPPSDEDSITLGIKVWLPNIDRDVKIDAFIGKDCIDTTVLNPYETEKWVPTLKGTKTQEVKIFIDDKLYQVFEVDFEERTADLTKDNSDRFSEE